MTTRWIRRAPKRGDDLAAAAISTAVAVGVGAATFYLARVLLAREPVPERERLDAPRA